MQCHPITQGQRNMQMLGNICGWRFGGKHQRAYTLVAGSNSLRRRKTPSLKFSIAGDKTMNTSPLLNPPNLAAPAPVSATLRCAPKGVATPTAKKVARRRKLARADWLDLFQHLQALKIMPKAEFLSEPYFSIDKMVLAISEESYQISAGTKNGAFERVSVEFASIQEDFYPQSYGSIYWQDRIYLG